MFWRSWILQLIVELNTTYGAYCWIFLEKCYFSSSFLYIKHDFWISMYADWDSRSVYCIIKQIIFQLLNIKTCFDLVWRWGVSTSKVRYDDSVSVRHWTEVSEDWLVFGGKQIGTLHKGKKSICKVFFKLFSTTLALINVFSLCDCIPPGN